MRSNLSKDCSKLSLNCSALLTKPFLKKLKKSKKVNIHNHFCCQSCAGRYNNTHKTHGTRRSKMETYLEEHLS
jgi:hypothetical protein